jgi:hypothetical protein
MGATLAADRRRARFEARFAPAALGPATGVAAVSATAGGTVSINLTGTGAPMLTASPTTVGFGDVASGATPERTVTLTNAGTVTTGTLTAAVTGDARFSIATDSCSAATVAARRDLRGRGAVHGVERRRRHRDLDGDRDPGWTGDGGADCDRVVARLPRPAVRGGSPAPA